MVSLPSVLTSSVALALLLALTSKPAASQVQPGRAASQPAALQLTDAVKHAQRVEQRALRSSFPELNAFGEAAAQRRDAEGLSRLQHVVRILINQADFAGAERWNDRLRESAQAQKDSRYLEVAEVNALQILHLRDRKASVADMEALVARTTDWLPRAFARMALARRYVDEKRIGGSLRIMLDTLPLIPADRATEASVAAAAWDFISIVHVMVDDVPGHLKAIGRAESYMAASDYPRPDYEAIYNLAQSLSYLSRHEEALALVDIYGRLAKRTNTPSSMGYAGNVCAFAAASREDWPAVLHCLAPFGTELVVPAVIKNSMLPFRATAFARTGDVARAARDVEEIQGRIERGEMSAGGGGVKRAEAELLIAQGDYARGVPALRDFHVTRLQRVSRAAASTMEQVVGNMEDQLEVATEQSRLKSEVIMGHRWLTALLVVLGAVLAGMIVLLLKHRRLYRRMAFTDALTGVANRRYTETRLEEMLDHARARQRPLTLVILDLDHFKSCNDRFGHDAGDEALRRFAEATRNALRPGDLFGRWGGEEFLLALPDADADSAKAVVDRVRAAAAAEKLTLAPDYPLRFSAGAVSCDATGEDLPALLAAADRALYQAKEQGRNRTVFAGG